MVKTNNSLLMLGVTGFIAFIAILAIGSLSLSGGSPSAQPQSSVAENVQGLGAGIEPCDISSRLRVGETKTFSIDGWEYEVTLVFLSSDGRAKVMVNGEVGPALQRGEYYIFGDVKLTVRGINPRTGVLSFCLLRTHEDPPGLPVCNGLRDHLSLGETKTYTLNGVEYETVFLVVNEKLVAKVMVNGEVSKEIAEGEKYQYASGVLLRMEELLYSPDAGLMRFCLSPPEQFCSDSDDGLDFFTPGTISGSVPPNFIVHDRCLNNGLLRETYCDYNDTNGDGYLGSAQLHNCSEGCVDDACVPSELPSGVLVLDGIASPFVIDEAQGLFIIDHRGTHYQVVMDGSGGVYSAAWALDGAIVKIGIDLEEGLVTFTFPPKEVISVIER